MKVQIKFTKDLWAKSLEQIAKENGVKAPHPPAYLGWEYSITLPGEEHIDESCPDCYEDVKESWSYCPFCGEPLHQDKKVTLYAVDFNVLKAGIKKHFKDEDLPMPENIFEQITGQLYLYF